MKKISPTIDGNIKKNYDKSESDLIQAKNNLNFMPCNKSNNFTGLTNKQFKSFLGRGHNHLQNIFFLLLDSVFWEFSKHTPIILEK